MAAKEEEVKLPATHKVALGENLEKLPNIIMARDTTGWMWLRKIS